MFSYSLVDWEDQWHRLRGPMAQTPRSVVEKWTPICLRHLEVCAIEPLSQTTVQYCIRWVCPTTCNSGQAILTIIMLEKGLYELHLITNQHHSRLLILVTWCYPMYMVQSFVARVSHMSWKATRSPASFRCSENSPMLATAWTTEVVSCGCEVSACRVLSGSHFDK